jgi:predicted ribosome quality control (RQC) complex YloA/Tae2 family protein
LGANGTVDNLVLIRVAAALDRELARAALREVREESHHRLRLLFAGERRGHSILVSLRPELPWLAHPSERFKGPRGRTGKLGAALSRALRGTLLAAVEKPTADRWVALRFNDGQALVVELATHGANLILLDGEGKTVLAARSPRSARQRIIPGEPYQPPTLPRRLLQPFDTEAAEIDRFLAEHADEDPPFELLRRRVFGIGTQGARLVLEESRISRRSAGEVLVDRLAALRRGELNPVVRCGADPLEQAERGELDLAQTVLLPWLPPDADEAAQCTSRRNAAATAGWYHESVERLAGIAQRLAALKGLLQKEIARLSEAEHKVAADLDGFDDPERYRRWGEALLAGLGHARRFGELVLVPDPYDAAATEIGVPCKPDQTPQQAADDHFRHHRRARRGLDQARNRARWLGERRRRLEAIAAAQAEGSGQGAIDALEQAMRSESIPVGLEPATRAGRQAARRGKPRLEGVRLFTASEGNAILVGRTGPANQRLTFKLAGPEDFWLHAQDCPGAHVVLRNGAQRVRPPREELLEAAALAAWYSDARDQEYADVQWTRRKYVRRPRGATHGTVLLKRFETIRVRPGRPPTSDGEN